MSEMICARCGTAGRTKNHTRGSLLIELILWLCMLVPGLIYSIWRLTTRRRVCAACGSEELVPTGSPVGRQLMERFSAASDSPRNRAGDPA